MQVNGRSPKGFIYQINTLLYLTHFNTEDYMFDINKREYLKKYHKIESRFCNWNNRKILLSEKSRIYYTNY